MMTMKGQEAKGEGKGHRTLFSLGLLMPFFLTLGNEDEYFLLPHIFMRIQKRGKERVEKIKKRRKRGDMWFYRPKRYFGWMLHVSF